MTGYNVLKFDKGMTLIEVIIALVISSILGLALVSFTRIVFDSQNEIKLRASRKSILDYYYYVASSEGTRVATQAGNAALDGHVRDLPGLRKTGSALSVIPTTIQGIPTNLDTLSLITVVTGSPSVLIPTTGLYLQKDGSFCDAACVTATQWYWKVTARWAAFESGEFEFYIQVEDKF